jgi:hypothetical protein
MNITYSQIFNLFYKRQDKEMSPIEMLYSLDLPMKTAFKVKRLMNEITNEYKTIEELRNKLVKKYDNGSGKVDNEKISEFTKGFNDILAKDYKIKSELIKESELENLDLNINLSTLQKISPIIAS